MAVEEDEVTALHLALLLLGFPILTAILCAVFSVESVHFYNRWNRRDMKAREAAVAEKAERLEALAEELDGREEALTVREQTFRRSVKEAAARLDAAYEQYDTVVSVSGPAELPDWRDTIVMPRIED